MDAGRETLDEYVTGTWVSTHAAHLAPRTRRRTRAPTTATSRRDSGARRCGSLTLKSSRPFRADLIRAGTGPHAIRKAMTLLGGHPAARRRGPAHSLQPAAGRPEGSAAAQPRGAAAGASDRRGDAPAADPRDATILSRARLLWIRPGELRALRWRDVRNRTLLVNAAKTEERRTVRLLAPLELDLEDWRRSPVCRRGALVFQRRARAAVERQPFEKWRQRVSSVGGRGRSRWRATYDLRHSFASLLLHEGRDVIYVAASSDTGPTDPADLRPRDRGARGLAAAAC